MTDFIKDLINSYQDTVEELMTISSNPETNVEVLRELSYLDSSEVLASLRCNPNTPEEILVDWLNLHSGIGGIDEQIRIHIVLNPAIKMETLEKQFLEEKSYTVKDSILLAISRRILNNDPQFEEINSLLKRINEFEKQCSSDRAKIAKKELIQYTSSGGRTKVDILF